MSKRPDALKVLLTKVNDLERMLAEVSDDQREDIRLEIRRLRRRGKWLRHLRDTGEHV